MAGFQTHLGIAAVTSMTGTAVCMQADMVNQSQALIVLSLGTLSGILPDIDSDHSIPTRMVFNLLSFAVAVAVLFSALSPYGLWYALGFSLLAAFAVRFVIYALFANITEHRGLFHSVPATLLFGLATVSSGMHLLGWNAGFAWLAAAFVMGGYLLHLLLDELYSVDLMGQSLKASFGTALTVFSRSSWLAYLALYAVVGFGVMTLPMPAALSL